MSTLEKVLLALIATGALTSAILPDRKTVPVLQTLGNVFQGSLRTSMTGK